MKSRFDLWGFNSQECMNLVPLLVIADISSLVDPRCVRTKSKMNSSYRLKILAGSSINIAQNTGTLALKHRVTAQQIL